MTAYRPLTGWPVMTKTILRRPCDAQIGRPKNDRCRLSKADAWASLPNWQENSACAAGDARSGRGLGEMTRRKREIVGLANEQDFPHLVELALPPGGFRSVFLEIDTFHRDRRIPVRRGRSRHEAEQFYIRFCLDRKSTRLNSSHLGISY